MDLNVHVYSCIFEIWTFSYGIRESVMFQKPYIRFYFIFKFERDVEEQSWDKVIESL